MQPLLPELWFLIGNMAQYRDGINLLSTCKGLFENGDKVRQLNVDLVMSLKVNNNYGFIGCHIIGFMTKMVYIDTIYLGTMEFDDKLVPYILGTINRIVSGFNYYVVSVSPKIVRSWKYNSSICDLQFYFPALFDGTSYVLHDYYFKNAMVVDKVVFKKYS